MQLKNKKILISLIVVFVVFVILPITLFFLLNRQRGDISGEPFNDPLSGETVYSPSDRTPETYGQFVNKPVILGLPLLLDRGVASDDIDNLTTALTTYFQKTGDGKEISIDQSSINHTTDASSQDVYSFMIRLDRDPKKDLLATTTLSDDFRLVLKKNNDTVFDSQVN